MAKIYFLTNAVLYLGLAVVCAVWQVQTSRSIGYVELNKSGQSEYLVVYGGMQLSFCLIYFMLARDPAWARGGLLFSLLLYAPLVAFRLVSLIAYRPTSPVTLGTAALEWAMLIWGWLAWRKLA